MATGTANQRFIGKTAIVTGSASGIGRRAALDFAASGANVVVTDIDARGMSNTASQIEELGGATMVAQCDVTDSEAVSNLVSAAITRFGSVDILVNNAGLLLRGTIEETSDELIERTLDINVKGVLYSIRAVTPYMKRQRYGKIISLSSIAGKNGDGSTIFAYGASKGAVMSLTRSVARQLGPYNVNVNAVAPHAVMTPMMDYWDEDRKKQAVASIPLRRLASAEDVASVILFLASEDAAFITGETINVNGGYYMD